MMMRCRVDNLGRIICGPIQHQVWWEEGCRLRLDGIKDAAEKMMKKNRAILRVMKRQQIIESMRDGVELEFC